MTIQLERLFPGFCIRLRRWGSAGRLRRRPQKKHLPQASAFLLAAFADLPYENKAASASAASASESGKSGDFCIGFSGGEELYETRSVSRSFSSSAEHRRFRERNRKTSWQRLMRDCTKQNIALCCADCLYALIRHASRATFPTGEGLDAAGMFPPNRCNHCRDQRSQRFAPAAAKNQAAVKPPGYPKNPFYSSTLSRLLACIDIRMMISANLCSSIGKPLLTHSFSSSSAPLTQ